MSWRLPSKEEAKAFIRKFKKQIAASYLAQLQGGASWITPQLTYNRWDEIILITGEAEEYRVKDDGMRQMLLCIVKSFSCESEINGKIVEEPDGTSWYEDGELPTIPLEKLTKKEVEKRIAEQEEYDKAYPFDSTCPNKWDVKFESSDTKVYFDKKHNCKVSYIENKLKRVIKLSKSDIEEIKPGEFVCMKMAPERVYVDKKNKLLIRYGFLSNIRCNDMQMFIDTYINVEENLFTPAKPKITSLTNTEELNPGALVTDEATPEILEPIIEPVQTEKSLTNTNTEELNSGALVNEEATPEILEPIIKPVQTEKQPALTQFLQRLKNKKSAHAPEQGETLDIPTQNETTEEALPLQANKIEILQTFLELKSTTDNLIRAKNDKIEEINRAYDPEIAENLSKMNQILKELPKEARIDVLEVFKRIEQWDNGDVKQTDDGPTHSLK